MSTIDTVICIDRAVKVALYEAHKGRCFYTGQHLPIEEMEIDHIKPRNNEGRDCLSNLVLAAKIVNRLKSNTEDGNLLERMVYINRIVFAPRALACLEGKLKTKIEATDIQRSCAECGNVFVTKRSKKRFCGDICRVKNWQGRFPRVDPSTGEVKKREEAQQ